jgi:hypothetical protein
MSNLFLTSVPNNIENQNNLNNSNNSSKRNSLDIYNQYKSNMFKENIVQKSFLTEKTSSIDTEPKKTEIELLMR